MEDNTLLIINLFLIGLCLSAIVVIVILVIHNSNISEEINKELKIDKSCPECPNCEVKCPDKIPCPECQECPEISKNGECPTCPNCNTRCPDCPSVDDIVSGIYPGRNPKVVDGGRYFQIDAANTYDGLSTSNFYDKEYHFPLDKILQPDTPMSDYNLGGEEQIDNSVENLEINTSASTRLPVIKGLPFVQGPRILNASTNNSSPVFDGTYQQILP